MADFQAARLRATSERPYLGQALCALVPVKNSKATLSVDRHWRIYYNPKWADKHPVEHFAGMLVHCVTHLLRDHGPRAENVFADPAVWEAAGDCEINDDLIPETTTAGLGLPAECWKPKDFQEPNGQVVETYYEHLLDKTETVPGESPWGGGSGASGSQGAKDYEAPGPDAGKDTPAGMDEFSAKVIQRETAEAIKRDKSIGTIPGSWKRWADGIVDPKVPWWRELPVAVRNAMADASGCVDYTYRRPSRRCTVTTAILPSMRAPRPRADVYVDTSGSMSEHDLAIALGAIKGVLDTLGPGHVRVFSVDAAVHNCQKTWNVGQVQLLGGGGTDMGEAVRNLQTTKPRPDMVIIVTDGYTPWPEANEVPRDVRFVTLLVSDGTPPSFGRVIRSR